MLNWALRETVTKLLFHKPVLPGPGFHALSYALLAVIYLVAILVPSGACGWAWQRMGSAGGRAGEAPCVVCEVQRHGEQPQASTVPDCSTPAPAHPPTPPHTNPPTPTMPTRAAVWTAMSVTGATAATFIAFILPGFLILRVASRTHRLSATSRVLALVCVVLGFTMGTVTLLNTFWLSKS